MENNNRIPKVYDIFIDFFGEDNVDLQDHKIIVHFPKVTVSNENDRSVDITHLWVKIHVDTDGTIDGTFSMIRSEFTEDQFNCGYSHSHIPHISRSNFNCWKEPCLGSGPIRGTIASLSTQFSEDMWNLFCLELSKYVCTESVIGTPYMYLERIGQASTRIEFIPIPFIGTPSNSVELSQTLESELTLFIPFVLHEKPFKFNFINGSYGIAMSDKEIFITLSNLYIEYYNSIPLEIRPSKSHLYTTGIVHNGIIMENKLYYILDSSYNSYDDYSAIIGTELFKFKGKPVTFNITPSIKKEDPNQSVFLNIRIVKDIIDRILRIINSKYGRENNQETNSSGEIYRYL